MPRERTHWEGCWRTHHDCALVRIAALEKDAARYRWLRDSDHWPAAFASHDAPEPMQGPELDAAIDAAMKD